MAQIQVFNIKTSILDYFWSINNMDNESPEYNETTLKEFSDELTKSLETHNRKAEIRWVIEEGGHATIKKFAESENIKHKLS